MSNDAFARLAPYDVIVLLKDKFPREKILQWLVDPKTPVLDEYGFYGLMAGLCGQPECRSAGEEIYSSSMRTSALGSKA